MGFWGWMANDVSKDGTARPPPARRPRNSVMSTLKEPSIEYIKIVRGIYYLLLGINARCEEHILGQKGHICAIVGPHKVGLGCC